MDDIEVKALALVNASSDEWYQRCTEANVYELYGALYRAIEQHEVFKQEVSNAVVEYYGGHHNASGEPLERFITPKPKLDPLAEAMLAIGVIPDANSLRAALEARGLEIREKGQC